MSIGVTVKHLAKMRDIQEKYKAEIAQIAAEIDSSALGQRLQQAYEYLAIAKEDVASAETTVREVTMDAYRNTNNKKPHDDVQVKMFTAMFYDPAAARDYARAHLPHTLKLDKRKFEQAAKVLDLDFVTTLKEPRVSIARDLSSYADTNV